MFSVVSVSLSVWARGGVPMWPLRTCSNLFTCSPYIYQTSRWLAFDWKAFLNMTTNEVAGKYYFQSCLSVHRRASYDHNPWCIGPHHTWIPTLAPALPPDMRPYYTGTLPQPPPPPHQMYSYLSNLDLTVHGPSPASDTFKLVELGPHCTGTPSPGHVQACSLCTTWTWLYRDPHPEYVEACSLWSTYGWQAGDSHPTGKLSCHKILMAASVAILLWPIHVEEEGWAWIHVLST